MTKQINKNRIHIDGRGKNKKIIGLTFVLCSLFLYIESPSKYSFSFCSLCLLVFLANALYLFKENLKYEFLGFNLFFTSAFGITNYLFPVIVFPIDSEFSLLHHGYNQDVLSKCTSLANLAYSLYAFGYLKYVIPPKIYNIGMGTNIGSSFQRNDFWNQITKRESILIILVAFSAFIGFVLAGGLDYYRSIYHGGDINELGVFAYISVFLSAIFVLLVTIIAYKKSIISLILSLSVAIIIINTGSRTLPLSIIILLLYIYTSKYHLSAKITIPFLIIGVFIMFLIGNIRGNVEGNYSNTDVVQIKNEELGYVEIFTDLIICSRNLYDAYEIVDKDGILWGTVFYGPILATIPFGQSLFCMIFNVPPHYMSSAAYFTYNKFGENAPVGLGTNIIGDVYLGGGIICVILLFYYLGLFTSKALVRMRCTGDLRWTLLYMVLLSNSVFMCRGSYFIFFKNYFWCVIIVYYIKVFLKSNNKHLVKPINQV